MMVDNNNNPTREIACSKPVASDEVAQNDLIQFEFRFL